MDARKKAKLKEMDGRATTVEDFLGMTPDEAALMELRLKLAEKVREHRRKRRTTQA